MSERDINNDVDPKQQFEAVRRWLQDHSSPESIKRAHRNRRTRDTLLLLDPGIFNSNIIFQDEGIIAVVKSVDVLPTITDADKENYPNGGVVENLGLREIVRFMTGDPGFWSRSHIGAAEGGVAIFAKNPMAGIMKTQFENPGEHGVNEVHTALVRGDILEKTTPRYDGAIELSCPIYRNTGSEDKRSRVADKSDDPQYVHEAMTTIYPVALYKNRYGSPYTLVRAIPRKRMSRQIVLSLARIHTPVVGDTSTGKVPKEVAAGEYFLNLTGSFEGYPMMCVTTCQFPHPTTGRIMRFEAPLSPFMSQRLDKLTLIELYPNMPLPPAEDHHRIDSYPGY